MSLLSPKDWDRHVVHAEEVARSPSFQALRDRIIALADPQKGDVAVDVGAGTGLLTLPLAEHADRVWAIDISRAMCEYLVAKARSAGLENVEVAVTSATSLPIVDASVDIVVSNYCFHHLDNADKGKALSEAFRILRPGGRLVFADMMFTVSVVDVRDRAVIANKLRALVRKGPAGVWRLLKNVLRFLSGRWEKPARPEWWDSALRHAGFSEVVVTPLEHESGLALGRRPEPAEVRDIARAVS
jgi:ubiquinone/menaquinone biosynthesis C-methylase UbiE